jgi:hypothetical protein
MASALAVRTDFGSREESTFSGDLVHWREKTEVFYEMIVLRDGSYGRMAIFNTCLTQVDNWSDLIRLAARKRRVKWIEQE